jgi:hypothetical protein
VELIQLAVPTRGRPEAFNRMVKSALETAVDPDSLLIIARVDDDDPSEYQNDHAEIRSGPRRSLGTAFDQASEGPGEIVMMCADDIRFRTEGWDKQVREAFETWDDRVGLVYGRDGIHDQQLATHGFVSRAWIEAVGCFVPAQLIGDYPDMWLTELASRARRIQYLPEVYTEHLHPVVQKAAMDDTYRDRPGPVQARARYTQLHSSGRFNEALDRLEAIIASQTATV